MLLEISIQQFAIIESVSLSFEQGMTVLTGETGAGKSIIIDAMNLLLGARATSDVVRNGSQKAEIEGLFSIENNPKLLQFLAEQGLADAEEVIIRREIFANGRSVSRLNGQLVNLSVLKEVGRYLVDIHGQHDQEELMKSQHHLGLLDSFGDQAFQLCKEQYQIAFDHYRTLRQQVLQQQKNAQEHKARIEMLAYQLAELDEAALQEGEDTLLQQERDKLLNYKQIADTLTNAYASLDAEDFSSLSHIRTAMNDLQSVEEYDADYQELATHLAEGYYILEEVTKRLAVVVDDLEFDSERLLQVESRLDVIYAMMRKYGGDLTAVLAYQKAISEEYQLLTGSNLSSEEMERQLKQAERLLLASAKELSQARHQIAEQLEAEIGQELKELYMEKARFQVIFQTGKFNREGNEHIEFYISANPGEDLKPLVKVASGGELSRLMLAIKAAFAKREDKTSIVFDEVDTGVSGRVAQAIAHKIYKIGSHGQVLAISHLPQVIAIADHQFFIEKVSDESKTVSQVRLLTMDERVEEIAKMLAGEEVSQAARTQARELLQK